MSKKRVESRHGLIVRTIQRIKAIGQYILGYDINKPTGLCHSTLLIHAAHEGDESQIKDLLENRKIDVNMQNVFGISALIAAVKKGHARIVQQLINHKDKSKNDDIDVNIADTNGNTALIYAAKKGYKEIAELLLKCPGIEVKFSGPKGSTALKEARKKGYHEIAALIEDKLKKDLRDSFPKIYVDGDEDVSGESLDSDCLLVSEFVSFSDHGRSLF